MKVKVLVFGIIKEIAGASSLEIELDEPNVDSLVQKLRQKHTQLQQLKSILVAVNNEYASGDQKLSSDDEIAIIPPVAGG